MYPLEMWLQSCRYKYTIDNCPRPELSEGRFFGVKSSNLTAEKTASGKKMCKNYLNKTGSLGQH